MKKNRDREADPLQADDQKLPTGAAATVPVFLVLALVLLGITVFFRQPRLLPRKHSAPPPEAAAGYVWLTGSPAVADGLYRFTPEQLADRFPAIDAYLAAQSARGEDPPVAAFDLGGDRPRPMRLPPAVANIFFQPIPINRADKDILASLPGIGPVLAARIVEHRRRQGPFRSKNELLQINGIGPKKYAGLVDHITLE